MRSDLLSAFLWVGAATSIILPIEIDTRRDLTSHLSNVHLTYARDISGPVSYTFGDCNSNSAREAHHEVGRSDGQQASRLVWRIPEGIRSDGCISAWSEDGDLLGRSKPQKLRKVKRQALGRRAANDTIKMNGQNGIDTLGPWFDGVELLSQKEPAAIDVEAAKRKEIGIVGAGMSGLMSFLILHQAGFTNVSILEAGQRLGGRVHTAYLSGGPFDYSYQEMGPMRFPYTYLSPLDNKTYPINDHRLVFSLAEEMNKINGNNKNFSVDFIPWVADNPNGLHYFAGYKLPSGLPPTVQQIADYNKEHAAASGGDGGGATVAMDSMTQLNKALGASARPNISAEIATNMFKAHRQYIDSGLAGMPGDHWSEFGFLVQYLNGSLEDASQLTDIASASFWDRLYGSVYGSAASLKTIDGGLSRLPFSFYPLVGNVTSWNRNVERVQFDAKTNKVQLQWREKRVISKLETSSFDYTLISAPFSVVKRWRLPLGFPAKITDAINKMPYTSACKVALEYSERFWEKYENPIFGGCSTSTDIPGMGTICYPSYNLNSSGPASVLASYVQEDLGERWASLSEEEHVQYVLDAMTEIHGEKTRDLYTGRFNRRCWILDPLESASWAAPEAGQHQLYIPEYFKTYSNMIFIGEHTSYTHAWVAAALESAVRGSVQLMLELGLVDEAKDAVEKWMARWIEV